MSVSARSAKSLTPAATVIDLPVERTAVRAGTYCIEVGDGVVTGWHSHDLHQLEYAFEGVAEVQTATARYLLPPQQAVWIPAGVLHSSTLTHVKAVSVFFDPAMGGPADDRVRVLAAAPVIREMVLYARRWPAGRDSPDPMADAFFDSLVRLVVEFLDHESPLCLPTTRDPLIGAAMEYTAEHLAYVTLNDVCSSIGTSERTLRRRFLDVTGMSWRQYLQESRLLKAMALLADSEQNLLAIAMAVGFKSASAFTRAVGRYTGEAPNAYRRRIRAARLRALPKAPTQSWDGGSWDGESVIRAWSHFDDPLDIESPQPTPMSVDFLVGQPKSSVPAAG
jgi:AraC-like DNA-binding protein/quercetin dioxygenase-like cupin family protein